VVQLSFNRPVFAFGVEMEPDPFIVDTMTAQFFNGAALQGTITMPVAGSAGSQEFAGFTNTTPFTRVVLSEATADFAFAQVRYSLNPLF
jgi:hypothetical protein